MKSIKLSESVKMKNMDKMVGHRLFGRSWFDGKFSSNLVSIAYQKYPEESRIRGISYGKKIYRKISPSIMIPKREDITNFLGIDLFEFWVHKISLERN